MNKKTAIVLLVVFGNLLIFIPESDKIRSEEQPLIKEDTYGEKSR